MRCTELISNHDYTLYYIVNPQDFTNKNVQEQKLHDLHPESVVLEVPPKPCLDCRTGSQGLVWQKIKEFNHWLPTRVVCTDSTLLNQAGKLWTTMTISNRLVDLVTKVALRAEGVKHKMRLAGSPHNMKHKPKFLYNNL